MLLKHKKYQNIDHHEDTKECEGFFQFKQLSTELKLRPVRSARYSSQLQLSYPDKMLVS